jgi:hypothetical protein
MAMDIPNLSRRSRVLSAMPAIACVECDGIASEDDLLNFFRKLPVQDRQLVVLPGASHSSLLGPTANSSGM